MQQITTEFMDTFGLDEDEFQEPDDSITWVFQYNYYYLSIYYGLQNFAWKIDLLSLSAL